MYDKYYHRKALSLDTEGNKIFFCSKNNSLPSNIPLVFLECSPFLAHNENILKSIEIRLVSEKLTRFCFKLVKCFTIIDLIKKNVFFLHYPKKKSKFITSLHYSTLLLNPMGLKDFLDNESLR